MVRSFHNKIKEFPKDINKVRDQLGIIIEAINRLQYYDIQEVEFGLADTEVEVEHDLGIVPSYYTVIKQDLAGSIYLGDSAWTNSKVYFKCDATDVVSSIKIWGE